ncbi:hypothetical protein Ahy_B05g077876 isoform F [Arachis hypogaea]|uniref:Uncharacterized protein n=1 Tax=Arachis hypogaea TaxID=3818 RepID=A0A444Z5T1_ARAHY|nr:hypothetical protein Ahy_B05g077876 isoform F [Arachis hypogaea]
MADIIRLNSSASTKEHLAAIGKSSGCQICGMIDPLQHNLRINFHGFLVLCLLLIVQKMHIYNYLRRKSSQSHCYSHCNVELDK